ncbi:hypothetical protein HanRHA438_Chr03g0127421 [Helianthus annuus]|uniref:Uncharacterized protein n=1 Tax=Helianthus annuus TaxID=4232 RepID=A0A9K3JH07_HELAN|nr:hypothetical protein HanXRQr2_Chr03g0115591 [Helianthus annuus]KAJ0593394.1 hypothetical protein HanHA300_Chr03g0096511 [Helianthus annuus]KAJ0768468.1 hypothetical protein HanLR1_Chr03g0101561 [Helianthus annuus]KAJ0936136.1 hypothetical protein HanRHA438_Chr03g0127421 [Helianthus annuus]KAJ0944068.1 hypothetical protein HanPSC8_Chr03g0112011 [Helianthus annuus]
MKGGYENYLINKQHNKLTRQFDKPKLCVTVSGPPQSVLFPEPGVHTSFGWSQLNQENSKIKSSLKFEYSP